MKKNLIVKTFTLYRIRLKVIALFLTLIYLGEKGWLSISFSGSFFARLFLLVLLGLPLLRVALCCAVSVLLLLKARAKADADSQIPYKYF